VNYSRKDSVYKCIL